MIRSLLRRKITGDLIFLYASFFASFVVPLLTIPFLTRMLGREAWGRLVFVQSFCALLGVPLAWGFGYHGVRLVARHRDDREKVGAICSEITAARLLLLIPTGLILLLCMAAVPALRGDLRLPVLGFAAVAINAFSAGWILQSLDRMREVSVIDLLAKLSSTLPVFLFVSSPADAYVVFLLQALGSLFALLLGHRLIRRDVPLKLRFTRSPAEVCRESSGMFLFSLSGALVNQTNSFLFGLFAPLHVIGIYAAAEKIIRSIAALVIPFSTALHTKINYRIGTDRVSAARLFVHGTAILFAGGLVVAAGVWLTSDALVARLFGPDFRESARVLRLLCVLPVVHWLSYSINLNWLIVLRQDRRLNACVFSAAAVSILSACVLVPLFSVTGMALSVLLTEMSLLAALGITLIKTKQDPLRAAFPPAADSERSD